MNILNYALATGQASFVKTVASSCTNAKVCFISKLLRTPTYRRVQKYQVGDRVLVLPLINAKKRQFAWTSCRLFFGLQTESECYFSSESVIQKSVLI